MDPITAVGLVASVAQLADLTRIVFLSFYQYYREVKNAPAQSKNLRDELQVISELLDSLKTVVSAPIAPSQAKITDEPVLRKLEQPIAQFERFLKELQTRVSAQRVVGIRRFKWPFSKKENQELLEEIGRYKETFTWALNLYQTYFLIMILNLMFQGKNE
jgi:Fungal N-terminal domain of STAND proteins